MQVETIDIGDILMDDDFNCRGTMAPIDVEDLAKDIQDNGLLQPVIVTPLDVGCAYKYKLIAGFRRTYACKILNYKTISAVIKSEISDVDASLLNLSENLKRRNLNILQEAKAIERLRNFGIPQEDIAIRVGKSRGWVQVRFALLDLPDVIQTEAAAGLLNQYQIKALAGKPQEKQFEIVKAIKTRRARGENSDDLLARKKPKPMEKRLRKAHEIKEMMTFILDQTGSHLGTKCLAWAAGGTNDFELFEAIKEAYPDFKPRFE